MQPAHPRRWSALAGGRLSDLFGAKRLFTAGWAVPAAGSLAAGLADSAGVEIAARAVQGAGAALIARGRSASSRRRPSSSAAAS